MKKLNKASTGIKVGTSRIQNSPPKMAKLKICKTCKKYTLKDKCAKCKTLTKDAHYKHIKLKTIQK